MNWKMHIENGNSYLRKESIYIIYLIESLFITVTQRGRKSHSGFYESERDEASKDLIGPGLWKIIFPFRASSFNANE